MSDTAVVQQVYRAVKGSRLTDADAAIVGPALEALAGELDVEVAQLQAEQILTAAAAKSSLLHGYFEWDDTEAARQYRLTQARYLARSWEVKVIISERDEPREFWVRGLLHITTEDEQQEPSGAYFPIKTVLSDPELLDRYVQSAFADLTVFQRKYEMYRSLKPFAPLSPVFEALDQLNLPTD